jgi:hypothetical protein
MDRQRLIGLVSRTIDGSGMKRIAILLLTGFMVSAMAAEARAGYTHYFTWSQPPDEAPLKACIADMGKIVAAAKDLVAGPDGNGTPVVGATHIEFNGRGNNAHEPFVFPGNAGFNFCKTQYKPYDAVVTACLIAAHDHFPSSVLAIASDGHWNEGDWSDGARLYGKALGRMPADPTSDFEEPQPFPGQPPFPGHPQQDSGFFNLVVLMVLGMLAVWWLARPRCAFTLFIEGHKLDRVRGDAPRQFLMQVDDICRAASIPQGTVRALQIRHWIWLVFSSGIPPESRQRIRNVWAAELWRMRLRGSA